MRIRLLPLLFAAALGTGIWAPRAGAVSGFDVRITGMKQGVFKGSHGIGHDELPAVAFRMDESTPRDLATGQATGRRMSSAVVITREFDGSSPELLEAAATHESLKEVDLIFPAENGAASHSGSAGSGRTLVLHDAFISELKQFGQPGSEMEDVSFVYSKMEWLGTESTPEGHGELRVEITGARQGAFTAAGGAKSVPALGFHYEIQKPRDAATGANVGHPQTQPFEITLPAGAISQKLSQALADNEVLNPVVIRSVETPSGRDAQQVYQITLKDARISRLTQSSGANGQMDDVSFTFGEIHFDFGGGDNPASASRPGDPKVVPFETSSQAGGKMAPAFYITITGALQHDFKSGSRDRNGASHIGGLAFAYDVRSPLDPGSGVVSGRLLHSPVTVEKEWGPATPQLIQAMDTNETLPKVVLEFLRREGGGPETVYETITLTNASITHLVEDGGSHSSEKVSFEFQKMEMKDVGSGVAAEVDWNQRL